MFNKNKIYQVGWKSYSGCYYEETIVAKNSAKAVKKILRKHWSLDPKITMIKELIINV